MAKLVILVLMVVGVVGCKKSEKGENSRWESGLQTVSELAVNYPGFKPALEAQRRNAETVMEAARKNTDKKALVKAMSNANDALTRGFVGQLGAVDKRIKDLRQTMVTLAGDAVSDDEKKVLREAKTQAESTLLAVEMKLTQGSDDPLAASALLNKVDGDLKFAEGLLAQVTTRINERVGAAAKATAAEASANTAEAEAAAQAVAPWTCEYCGHENSHETSTCSNCQAARPSSAGE